MKVTACLVEALISLTACFPLYKQSLKIHQKANKSERRWSLCINTQLIAGDFCQLLAPSHFQPTEKEMPCYKQDLRADSFETSFLMRLE